MKIYQLHLNGKDRAYHNFKTREEAEKHQSRLIAYIRDRIGEGQLGFRQYMQEAQSLKVVELEIKKKTKFYSVVEHDFRCSGIVKTFPEREIAEDYKKPLEENSERIYSVMESTVNDAGKNYPRKKRDDGAGGRKAV